MEEKSETNELDGDLERLSLEEETHKEGERRGSHETAQDELSHETQNLVRQHWSGSFCSVCLETRVMWI